MKTHDREGEYSKSLQSKCLQRLLIYKHRIKSRRALLKLDDRMLQDIGISREQARTEVEKPFWKGDSYVFDTQEYSRLRNKVYVGKTPKSGGVSF